MIIDQNIFASMKSRDVLQIFVKIDVSEIAKRRIGTSIKLTF